MLRPIGRLPALLLIVGMALTTQPFGSPNAEEVIEHQRGLMPETAVRGPALEVDFPGLSIGIAEYPEGPTGTTVFRFDKPAMAAVDVRGGAPGTIGTDGLRLGYDDWGVHAICLSGGSAYGLAASTGVTDAIKERIENPGHWENIVGVSGAIIFDLGGRRFNAITPDYELGKAALAAAVPGRFPLGAQGAGRFAMQGWLIGDPQYSGQGGASLMVGPTRIAVFTVVNSGGAIVDREGRVVRCSQPGTKGCGSIQERLRAHLGEEVPGFGSQGLTANTTISLLVTNQKMPFWALQRLAVQVHTSMARAIQPFSTVGDGDTLFAVTTNEVENDDLSFEKLGTIASEVAWDAVLASVPQLPERSPRPAAPVEIEDDWLDALAGEYELSPWARMRIVRAEEKLEVIGPKQWNLYFPTEGRTALLPVSDDEFVIDGPRGDRLHFENEAGRITGLVINRDGWPVRASRLAK